MNSRRMSQLFIVLSIGCGGAEGDAESSATSTTSTSSGSTTTGGTSSDGPTGAPDTSTDTTATSDTPTTGAPGDTTDDTATTAPPETTDATTTTTGDTDDPSTFALPPADAGLDYQLGGAYPPPPGVGIVARDRNAAPAAGLYNICYVNGFQSQPDEESFWLDMHPDLVLRDANDEPVIDLDWDEMLLDTRTPEKRAALAEIVGGWIVGCGGAGYQAIEIDNLDSYARSNGLLSEDDNVAFMTLLSAAAHSAGMAIAQKNSTELVPRRAEMGTDFVVAEECNHYAECDDYIASYGDAVLMIEYFDEDFATGCAAYPQMSIVRRDLDLTTPGDDAYVYDAC